MELIVYLALFVSVIATFLGVISKDSKRTVYFLAIQAAAIGFVELMYVFVNLFSGLHFEALIKFFTSFAEWFSAAAISPLIIYWGVTKTENYTEESMLNKRGVAVFLVILILSHLGLEYFFNRYLPSDLETGFFISLMFSLSLFMMATRRDPFKLLVGLNMAENALYPLLSRSPLHLIPFVLVLKRFVNIVAVYIVIEVYKDYGTLDISDWRLSN